MGVVGGCLYDLPLVCLGVKHLVAVFGKWKGRRIADIFRHPVKRANWRAYFSSLAHAFDLLPPLPHTFCVFTLASGLFIISQCMWAMFGQIRSIIHVEFLPYGCATLSAPGFGVDYAAAGRLIFDVDFFHAKIVGDGLQPDCWVCCLVNDTGRFGGWRIAKYISSAPRYCRMV